uniref:Uncharacterized protein n=2 Tax=Parascaris univalens TaxID=6257 RepID=A0A915ATP4_PARUN
MPLFDICCMSSSVGKGGGSTPYIPCENKGSDLIEPFFASSVDLKENCDDYEQSITRSFKGCNDCVRFNAGSAAGSTDMLNLIRLYQESDDRDTVERWMDIFAQNKLNQSAHNSTQHSYENAYLQPSSSDLCDCLDERSPSDVQKANFSLIRSMDPLPPSKDSDENSLEKCHSADFKHVADDRKKLQRCEEMTDIFIDDYR